jgi:hypothetical protein
MNRKKSRTFPKIFRWRPGKNLGQIDPRSAAQSEGHGQEANDESKTSYGIHKTIAEQVQEIFSIALGAGVKAKDKSGNISQDAAVDSFQLVFHFHSPFLLLYHRITGLSSLLTGGGRLIDTLGKSYRPARFGGGLSHVACDDLRQLAGGGIFQLVVVHVHSPFSQYILCSTQPTQRGSASPCGMH